MNDSGTLIFSGLYPTGMAPAPGQPTPLYWAIFSPTKVLVQPGNVISGKTVKRAAEPHLNNAGEFAFTADFTDGSSSIVLATPVAPTPVLITVNAIVVPKTVNSNSRGRTPVAILSSPTFNAHQTVDQTTLTFGRTGTEHSLVSCVPGAPDLNGDGLGDLLCQFGATILGRTTSGTPFQGTAAVDVR